MKRVSVTPQDPMKGYQWEDTGRESRKNLQNSRVPFTGKILIIGCGAIAQCCLPLIPKLIDVHHKNITVIDMVDVRDRIKDSIAQGVNFLVEKITRENLLTILGKYLTKGDLLVDLAWEIATVDFLRWTHENKVLYINASVEIWEPYMNAKEEDARKFTLYDRHMVLSKLYEEWGGNTGATAVLDHGANPGWVSHAVKQGLEHIAEKIITEKPNENPARTNLLKDALAKGLWGPLAMNLGVKVIHVAERDTQVSKNPKRLNEFVNTWSPEGFYEEGLAPAELGWGTHERKLPPGALEHPTGPKNQICLRTKGMNTVVRSWSAVKGTQGDFHGMVVRHGEAFTMTRALTVKDEAGHDIYRPTVHYAYCPSDSAIASLHELRMRHYKTHEHMRVLHEHEIVSGGDYLGVLLMGHDYNAWWIGSQLEIEEARELVPEQNATTVQVSISMVSAMQWIIRNPGKGVCVPDDLPHKEILRECYPYLGPFISQPVDWTPVRGIKEESFCEYQEKPIPKEPEDSWQFESFLVSNY